MSAPPTIAHLGRAGGDPDGLAALAEGFRMANPGYDVAVHRGAAVGPSPGDRVLFVHGGEARMTVGTATSPVGVGDVVLLRGGEAATSTAALTVVAFTVPAPLPSDLPAFLRPDHDPLITDTPGGCAEEADAYRRVVLTWLADNGPYTFDALNAHRVRMWDSFSHYHPPVGGFDEIYLVQDVRPGGHVLFSVRREELERPDRLTRDAVAGLVERIDPEPGDLVHIPRGTVHRGVGGVLAHVITVPGFKPGFEIGVDHHLRAINERLGLGGGDALPFQEAASRAPLVK